MIVYDVTYKVDYAWQEPKDKKQELVLAIQELSAQLGQILSEEYKEREEEETKCE